MSDVGPPHDSDRFYIPPPPKDWRDDPDSQWITERPREPLWYTLLAGSMDWVADWVTRHWGRP